MARRGRQHERRPDALDDGLAEHQRAADVDSEAISDPTPNRAAPGMNIRRWP